MNSSKVMAAALLVLQLAGCENGEQAAQIEKLESELAASQQQLEEWSKKYREALEALNVSEEVEYRAPDEELSVRQNTGPLSAYTREKVEQMLGQPGEVAEEIGVHSGSVETTLIYPEASFTFVSGKLKSLVLRTDYFTTSKGIHVGSSKEDVVRAYGKMFYLTDDGFFYGEKTGIRFKLADGQVEEIRIWLMYE